MIEKWLQYWHGVGEEHQHDYYRCHGCRRVVTWTAIKHGGCDCGISTKLSPARLRRREKVLLVLWPWGAVR